MQLLGDLILSSLDFCCRELCSGHQRAMHEVGRLFVVLQFRSLLDWQKDCPLFLSPVQAGGVKLLDLKCFDHLFVELATRSVPLSNRPAPISPLPGQPGVAERGIFRRLCHDHPSSMLAKLRVYSKYR